MSGGSVERSREGDVEVLRLSNPAKANALGKADLRRLRELLEAIDGAAGVVVTGEGANFSSGFDLDERTGGEEDDEIDELLSRVGEAAANAPVPVLAAIEGACIGAAFDLAMQCDAVVAGEDAFFGVPATHLGVVYREPLLREVVARAGDQTAAALFLLGRRLDAPSALRSGLIAEVVERGAAFERARRLVDEASAGAPAAVAGTKAQLRRLRSLPQR